MSPDFADVAGRRYGNATATNGLADSILQLKAVKRVAGRCAIDIFSKTWTGLP